MWVCIRLFLVCMCACLCVSVAHYSFFHILVKKQYPENLATFFFLIARKSSSKTHMPITGAYGVGRGQHEHWLIPLKLWCTLWSASGANVLLEIPQTGHCMCYFLSHPTYLRIVIDLHTFISKKLLKLSTMWQIALPKLFRNAWQRER